MLLEFIVIIFFVQTEVLAPLPLQTKSGYATAMLQAYNMDRAILIKSKDRETVKHMTKYSFTIVNYRILQ